MCNKYETEGEYILYSPFCLYGRGFFIMSACK